MRTGGTKSYHYYHRETLSSCRWPPHMLHQQSNRARPLRRGNAGLHGPVTNCLTVRARSPPEGSAIVRKTPVQFEQSVSASPRRYAARRPVLGLERRAGRERSRSSNVDLTCTLPQTKVRNTGRGAAGFGMAKRIQRRIARRSSSAAQRSAGHKVSQSAAACGERRQTPGASVKSHRRGSL